MAMLQRVRMLPNQRLDLPDFNRIEDFMCADLKAIHRNVWSSQNFVFSGFEATGTGTNTLDVPVADSSLIVGQDDGALYIGAPSLSPLSTDNLSPGTTNYVEITVDLDTGGADSRAFWDATANSGQGAEFSQIVDTFTFLKASLKISTSNFSGDPDAVKICEVDVNGSGVITEIRDRRDMFWRLGRGTNTSYTHPWASRVEPPATQFTGADKDLKTFKMWADAVMDSFREIKGTTYWYELAPVSLQGSFRSCGLSVLTQATGGAKFSWSGTQLSITDDSGVPADSDVIAYLRLFDSSANLNLTRQDGVNAITIADGEILWVELPDPLTSVTYDGVGLTSSNYRITARGSVPLDDDTYWLAYREGSRLYVRGLGELDPGEAVEVSDQVPEALEEFLGFNPETATSVPYTQFPNGSLLPATFTSADNLVTAIDAETENINYIAAILDENPYEERMDIVSGAPANDNEFTGPVAVDTIIPLPLDSRDSDNSEFYIVGLGQLMLFLNGQFLDTNIDWEEVGTAGNPSSSIKIKIPLVVGDKLVFRNAQAGGLSTGGGGGPVSLQTAYSNGNTITTTSGVPFTVGGAATKVAQFNGDIGVTGVIDPAGITFTPQVSNPLGTDNGLWVDNSGNLMHSRPSMPPVNVTAAASGNGTASGVKASLINQSGGALSKLTPVAIDVAGYINNVDVSVEASAMAVVGIVSDASIANGATGNVITDGKLEDITTSASYGDVLYVSKTGMVTNVKPSVGVGGFVEGDFMIRLGVISRNVDNPLVKDLIVNVQVVGQV